MAKQHDKQFKLDAVQYYQDHKDLGVRGCAENLVIGYSTLTKWLKDFRESGDIPVRGSGNYASDVLTIGIVLCLFYICLLYTSPSPRDVEESRMPSSA